MLGVRPLLVYLIALASHLFGPTLIVVPALAHHAGDSDVQMLVEGTQGDHHVVLEVAPRELIAGSVATFSLWMWRIGTGSPYTGRAILSMQLEGGPASSKTQIPIPETGRAGVSVLYRGTHRFEQEGTYRLDLELPDLPARWAASLPVRPATTWYSSILQSVGAVVLAAGSLVLILAFLVAAGVRGPRRGLSWLRSRRS